MEKLSTIERFGAFKTYARTFSCFSWTSYRLLETDGTVGRDLARSLQQMLLSFRVLQLGGLDSAQVVLEASQLVVVDGFRVGQLADQLFGLIVQVILDVAT